MSTNLESPFLDLFILLQRAGMKLSPEHYDLLRQALGQGFGLRNWDPNWQDLREVCRILWVKPSHHFDREIFEETFTRYVRQKSREIRAQRSPVTPPPETPKSPQSTRRLPQVPPRKMPAQQPTQHPQVPIAIKTESPQLPEVDQTDLCLTPTDLPLPTRTVLDSWCLLRRPLREGSLRELDLEATVERINQAGYFTDVVMRPVLSKRAELILLVDDSDVMLPFQPALQPLVEAIESRQISPGYLFRFTTFPDDYLYDWDHPTRAISLDQILSRMHPRRSIVVIWSEGGTTQSTQFSSTQAYRLGWMTFLIRLNPCLRQLVWLNPFPQDRWQGTLAQEIARLLDGRMISVDGAQVLELAKQPVSADPLVFRALS